MVELLNLDRVITGQDDLSPVEGLLAFRTKGTPKAIRAPYLHAAGSLSDEWKRSYCKQAAELVPPSVLKLRDATVIGHGVVVTASRRLLHGKCLVIAEDIERGNAWTFGRPPSDILSHAQAIQMEVLDPIVPLLRPGDHIYGHWLIDILTKVTLVSQLREGLECRFLVSNRTPAYAYELLEALGVSRDRCVSYDPLSQTVLTRHLLLPTSLRQGNFLWPGYMEMYSRIRRHFMKEVPGAPHRLVYLPRPQNDTKRRLLNAQDVLETFKHAGFEIVRPETLSFEQQMPVYASARILAAECGSALHNSVFCSRGTAVLELRSNSDASFVQASLCDAVGQSIGYVVGEAVTRPKMGRESPWIVDTNCLRSVLEALIGDRLTGII